MATATDRVADMLKRQIYLLKINGFHKAAAQAADGVRRLRLLASLEAAVRQAKVVGPAGLEPAT